VPTAPRRIYSFWIDHDLAEGLKRVKERDGVPESEQLRRAVREWLEARDALPRQPRVAPGRGRKRAK
jgi:hypothetical protein